MARLLVIMKAKCFIATKTQNIFPELLKTAKQFVIRDVQEASGNDKDLQNTSDVHAIGKYCDSTNAVWHGP